MNSKNRLLTAWDFKEPDRVPIEMLVFPKALESDIPGAKEIYRFQNEEADNFLGVSGFDWGFLGLDSEYSEKIIEDVSGSHIRMKRTHITPAGAFDAITKHRYEDLYGDGDPGDYHWEKRFVETIDDFMRVIDAKRTPRPFDKDKYNEGCVNIGTRGVPVTGLLHPLGVLVRNSNMSEVYMWMRSEEEKVFEFLEKSTKQVCDSILSVKEPELADPLIFKTHALEMFIPPWFGKSLFMKYIYPFDKQINETIHQAGGRHMAHCHGNSGGYLELFADMGIDALDPLEPAPYGDNNLSDAKKRVGNRMLLQGNIPSQVFGIEDFDPDEVYEMTKTAISQGAVGGGFTLRTTGSAYVGNGKTRAQKAHSIKCGHAIIKAWRENRMY